MLTLYKHIVTTVQPLFKAVNVKAVGHYSYEGGLANGKRGLLEGSNFGPISGSGWRVGGYQLLTKKKQKTILDEQFQL